MTALGWEDGERKKRIVIRSMIVLAAIAVAGGIVTNLITQQVRAQDPLYQCIKSEDQPYQAYVTLIVTVDNQEIIVPANIGISADCVRPIHTHDANGVIHVAYEKPYEFKLGHFLWYWNFDVLRYDATAYVNGFSVDEKYLDTVLQDGMSVRIDFKSKESKII
jgi:hypothetical protein